MHDGNAAILRCVRVSVRICDLAVGGPAGVSDPGHPGHVARYDGGEFIHPSDALVHLEPTVVHGQASGVVAAVLQTPESIDEQRRCFTESDVAEDAAHLASL